MMAKLQGIPGEHGAQEVGGSVLPMSRAEPPLQTKLTPAQLHTMLVCLLKCWLQIPCCATLSATLPHHT